MKQEGKRKKIRRFGFWRAEFDHILQREFSICRYHLTGAPEQKKNMLRWKNIWTCERLRISLLPAFFSSQGPGWIIRPGSPHLFCLPQKGNHCSEHNRLPNCPDSLGTWPIPPSQWQRFHRYGARNRPFYQEYTKTNPTYGNLKYISPYHQKVLTPCLIIFLNLFWLFEY